MLEPDVTLTDYALSVECAIGAVLLGRTPTDRRGLRAAGTCFFIFFGLSAATGGTVHGYCADNQSSACQFLWQLTLQAIGVAACSAWMLGAGLIATGRTGRWLALASIPQIALYGAGVSLVTREFWITFTIYLPAVVLLFAGFCRAIWNGRRFALVGASGLMLSFVSCLIQFLKIGLHPVYFNHNALAHAVQAIALGLIFLGIRFVVGSDFLESRVAQTTVPTPLSG